MQEEFSFFNHFDNGVASPFDSFNGGGGGEDPFAALQQQQPHQPAVTPATHTPNGEIKEAVGEAAVTGSPSGGALFGNPPTSFQQDTTPFKPIGSSPSSASSMPSFFGEDGHKPFNMYVAHDSHSSPPFAPQLNGHNDSASNDAPGSNKLGSSSLAGSAPHQQPQPPQPQQGEKGGDLADLFAGTSASDFDSFLHPPASGTSNAFPFRLRMVY